MKLLYLHNAPISTTAANLVQVVSMCNAFANAGFDTVLALRGNASASGSDSFALHHPIFHEKVKLRILLQTLPARLEKHISQYRIKEIIREEQPDLCFVRDPRYFRSVLRAGKPVILELHNTRMHLGNKWLDRLLRRWIIRGANHPLCLQIIAISGALSGFWVSEGLPGEKMITLHDGFSGEMFGDPLSKQDARLKLGLPSDRRIIVYAGNLQANRGIHHILDLAENFPDLWFLMVGGNPERKRHYEAEAERRGLLNLDFRGHQPHSVIPLYLYAADILLAMWSKEVPTINYCSPLKLFEYLATGKPFMVPGYPTITEVVEDGTDAFVAMPDDPVSFRSTLQRILETDEAELGRMSENARKKAIEMYTWDKRAASIIARLPEALRPMPLPD